MHPLNMDGAASRRPAPVALVIASEFYMASHRRLLALRGLRVEVRTPEAALADRDVLPACALVLVETTGLAEPVAASLVALVAKYRRREDTLIFLCPLGHIDFLGPLQGTGAALLCEPSQAELDCALRDAVRTVWQRRLRDWHARPGADRGPRAAPPWPQAETGAGHDRPYWLDILSDALTGLALAHQAEGPERTAIAALLDQMIAALLALPSDRALLDAVELALPGEGPAELGRLVAELERRGVANGDAAGPGSMGSAAGR